MKFFLLYRAIAAMSILLILSACESKKPLEAAEAEVNASAESPISFLKDIKPILDARCVVCHSCYNSPCQLKFSSYEGLMRGGSKALVYDGTRLNAIAPTRLFMDANSTKEWRDKGFFSVAHSSVTQSENNALMVDILDAKKRNPQIDGVYAYDYSNYTCAKDAVELDEMLEDRARQGCGYGFPALKESEYQQIARWIEQGATGPTQE